MAMLVWMMFYLAQPSFADEKIQILNKDIFDLESDTEKTVKKKELQKYLKPEKNDFTAPSDRESVSENGGFSESQLRWMETCSPLKEADYGQYKKCYQNEKQRAQQRKRQQVDDIELRQNSRDSQKQVRDLLEYRTPARKEGE